MDGDTTRVGQTVKRLRRAQGKTIATVAGLAGISKAHLSRLERGERRWDSRALIASVANALDVSPGALLGQPFGDNHDGQLITQGIRRVRRALTDTSLTWGADITPRPLAALQAEATEMTRLRQNADYISLGARLPSLIAELHAWRNQREALVALCETLGAASSMLTITGAYAESLLATDRHREAAGLLGDQRELASVEWSRAHALIPDGSTFVASLAAGGAAETMPHGEKDLPTFGALLLVAGYACAVRGDTSGAQARLDEAGDVAARTGETGDATTFGPNNVALHRVAVSLEAGQPDVSLRCGAGVNPATIPAAERRAMFEVDMGRAHAYAGKPADAIQSFRRAERIAPHRAHANQFARETIADLLDSARRLAGEPQLTGLANRFGVIG